MTDSPLRVIRDRRAVIARDLASLDGQVAALRAEDARLQIAEEVVVDLTGTEPARRDHKESTKARKRKKATAPRPKSGQRPTGIPQSPDMIRTALSEAFERGRPGLRPEEIRDFIRDRWWPGVQFDAIGPTVWRMWKDGRLDREGSIYCLLKNEAPAGETAGASRSGPAVNGTAVPPVPPDNGRSDNEVFNAQNARA